MKKLNNFGLGLTLLFPIALFVSYKGQQTLSYIIYAFFLICMFSKKNRQSLMDRLDKKLTAGLVIFIALPFIISLFSGGLTSRVDIDHYLFWLIFFPLVFFIDTEKKLQAFIISFLAGGAVSLFMTLGIFIKNYDSWARPVGFEYPRIAFALQEQDFANIMCIFLLFLLSFLLFYKNVDKQKNLAVKIILSLIIPLNLFIIIVNRSKMVYICILPAIVYILFKKNKKYILIFMIFCIGGFIFLPNSITDRIKDIPKVTEDPSSNLRLIFWDAAISSIQKSPILGMKTEDRISFNFSHFKEKGVLEYVEHFYGLDEVGITNTHNMYLHHLANYGIIGFTGLLYLFFIVIPGRLISLPFSKAMKNRKSHFIHVALEIGLKASYLAYLIQGITEFNLNKKPMVFTCSILLFLLNFLLYPALLKKEATKIN